MKHSLLISKTSLLSICLIFVLFLISCGKDEYDFDSFESIENSVSEDNVQFDDVSFKSTSSQEGVTLYKDRNFNGGTITYKEEDREGMPAVVGNDRLSSVIVSDGYYVELYLDTGYRGKHLTLFPGEYASLEQWDNRTSSFKVKKYDSGFFPLVNFYEDEGRGGWKQTLTAIGSTTDYSYPFLRNDRVSLLEVPYGVTVTLYSREGLGGSKVKFGPGSYNLRNHGFNDRATSVKIELNDVEEIGVKYTIISEKESGTPMNLRDISENHDDDSVFNRTLTLKQTKTETWTRSWSNQTLVGLTISKQVGTSFVADALTAEANLTVTGQFQNTFTIGRADSGTDGEEFNYSTTVPRIEPRTRAVLETTLTPRLYEVEAEYTLRLKMPENTPNGVQSRETTVTAKIEIGTFQSSEIKFYTEPLDSAPIGKRIAFKKSGGIERWILAEKYVDNNQLVARGNEIKNWEQFYVKRHPFGGIALQALSTGKYVRVNPDGSVTATGNVDNPGQAENFEWESLSSNTMALKSVKNGKYLQARWSEEKAVVKAVGNSARNWETFEYVILN